LSADGIEHAYRRNQPFVILCNATAIVKFPGSTERKMLSDWLHDPQRIEKEKRYIVATAVVIPSGPIRALLSAIQFVSPPNYPQVWKATEPEAFEWCYERIVGAKLPLTKALEAARAEDPRRSAVSVKQG
jgi:hypothetical protein